ncbi:unnamed protein product [Meloidogyne enterolobii]|uniref:Uncharacterized protein n=1 Tax=Meloidogyne enterolobii TaxID=390850 RepID=A0ACB1APR9_MELEN
MKTNHSTHLKASLFWFAKHVKEGRGWDGRLCSANWAHSFHLHLFEFVFSCFAYVRILLLDSLFVIFSVRQKAWLGQVIF